MKNFLLILGIIIGIIMIVCSLLYHWLFLLAAVFAFLFSAFIKK